MTRTWKALFVQQVRRKKKTVFTVTRPTLCKLFFFNIFLKYTYKAKKKLLQRKKYKVFTSNQ